MYTIDVLPSKKFDQLPYNTDGASGLTDYKKKRAYVRESGIPALDLLVMGHELQELVSKVSPHDEDGIRYKKQSGWMQIASIVAPIAIGLLTGGAGFALAPWFGSTMTGALLGGATSAGLTGGKPAQWGTAALGGALGGGGGAAMGSSMFGAGAQASKNAAVSGLGKSFANSQAGTFASPLTLGNTTYGVTGGAQGLGAAGLGGTGRGLAASMAPSMFSRAMGTAGSNMGMNMAGSSAVNMLNSSINPSGMNPNYSLYAPEGYGSSNMGSSALGYGSQAVRPTPNSAVGAYTNSYTGETTDLGSMGPDFNYLIPGMRKQGK